LADPLQGLVDVELLDHQLSLVVDVLKLASAAHSEMWAGSGNAQGRRLEDFFDLRHRVVPLLRHDAGAHALLRRGERHKHLHAVKGGEAVAALHQLVNLEVDYHAICTWRTISDASFAKTLSAACSSVIPPALTSGLYVNRADAIPL
jgi:hypothetical protein